MIKSIELLRQNELFGSLTEEELSRLAPLCSDFVAIEDSGLQAIGRKCLLEALSHLSGGPCNEYL